MGEYDVAGLFLKSPDLRSTRGSGLFAYPGARGCGGEYAERASGSTDRGRPGHDTGRLTRSRGDAENARQRSPRTERTRDAGIRFLFEQQTRCRPRREPPAAHNAGIRYLFDNRRDAGPAANRRQPNAGIRYLFEQQTRCRPCRQPLVAQMPARPQPFSASPRHRVR